MKVLVTGAGALLGQGIIRSLEHSALDIELVAVDPSPLSAGLYWAGRHHLVPLAADPAFLPTLERIIAEERPDAVLVGTDAELSILAAQRQCIESEHDTSVIVANPETVRIADDKYLTSRFLAESGFRPAESRLPEQAHELVAALGFPLIVKPRIGARAIGLSVVHDQGELDSALAERSDLVVQELVGDDECEFTAGTLTFDGVCQASILMRRDLRDGNTYRAFVVKDPAIDAQVRAMAEALGAHGPANFQFRTSGGEARVFEINCRFSGTTPLRALVGFNEVELALRHLVLGEPVVQPQIRDAVILRYWSEIVLDPAELLPLPPLP